MARQRSTHDGRKSWLSYSFVYEVLDALMKLHAIQKEEVAIIQLHKRSERGGFERRTFVGVAEHPLNSFGERYCLADPVKYPEVE